MRRKCRLVAGEPGAARGRVLGACAVFLAGIWSVDAAQAQTSSDPIKIGIVAAKQGPWTIYGTTQAHGIQFALEQAGSKALGRDVQVIWYDEADPNDARQNMTKLVEQDKVAAVLGGSNSATALAMSALAKQEKIPFILGAGSAKELTGTLCNRYTFRSSFSLPVANRALGSYILELGKKWYFLAANYSFGQDTYALLKPYLLAHGGTEAGHDDIPLGTSDFSSFILKIRQANPDVIVAGVGGADFTNFLKQFADYGLSDTIRVANPFVSDDYIWALSPEAATGLYTEVWHYDDPTNTPDEKAFVDAWMKKYAKPPTSESWEGWISMRMLLAAIKQAGATDSRSIVSALETIKVDSGGEIPYYYRKWDHQMLKRVPIVKAHAPPADDKWKMLDVVADLPKSIEELDAYYGDQKEVGCQMEDF
jgi:branched-chain amino acid transport system substrate-binding protein